MYFIKVLLSDTISLLIFCLEDLSIFDSGVLKSPTIIVLLSISLEILQDFLHLFGCSFVGCIYIYHVYVFLVDSSFEYYEVTMWVFLALLWKSILSDMSIATPAFFSCPFAWKICFQASLPVCVSLLS